MNDLKLEEWQPMPPEMGPPLPRSLGIYWPWYKLAVPPEVVPTWVELPVPAPPVVPIIVAPPAAPPVIAYPPVAYPPMEAPPVIIYPPAPPEVPAPPEAYYLYVDTVGEGVVTPSTGDYPARLPLTLIATPAPGYAFDYWGGDVSGTIPAVRLLMDSDKAVTAYFKPIPARPPKLPTVSISSVTFTPSEATVGDVVSGTISWMPTMAGSPELFDFGISADLIDSAGGRVMNVLTASPTGEIGMLQATPFSLDTTGLPEGWYGLQVHFSDLMTGVEIAKRRFPNLFHLLPVPEIPTAPTLPTADMFATPFVNLPTEVEIGEIWSGNISMPTQVPFALQALPSLPSYPVDVGLQLQSPIGQLFDVGASIHTFMLGQTISLPVNFDTSVLPQEGIYNLILNISDLQGNPLFSNVIGSLRALMPVALPEVPIPEAPVPHAGTIIKKELEYNESRGLIPAYNVPQGERGKVHIWGRNDMPIRQKLGIHWIVQDPDGLIAEDYQDWQFARMDPGNDHEFISPGRFDLNKPGNWTISISLSINPDAPLTVDSYAGVLCTVAAAPPPEAPPAEYTLEVAIEPPGAGLVIYSPKKATYSAGDVVTLVATPNPPRYEFDHWGGWGSGFASYPGVGSTSDTLKITMSDNWWVVAAFREVAPPPEGPPPYVPWE